MRFATALALAALLGSCGPAEEELLPSSADLRQALDGLPPRVQSGLTAEGTVRIEPASMTAGEIGSWQIHFRVGAGGIGAGGGILVDLPKEWLSLRHPLSKPAQQRDADGPHYFGVESSRPEADLALELERLSFDSKVERYPHVLAVTVRGEPLRAGDEIRLRISNTTAPFLASTGEVRVAVDSRGYGEYALTGRGARYQVAAGSADRLLVVAPSDVEAGRRATVRVTLFDRFHNPVPAAAGKLIVGGLGHEPLTADLDGSGTGVVTLHWAARATGVLWPVAEYRQATGERIQATGNPVRVHDSTPERRIFWGDLHSHSTISKDAIGTGDFEYARDVTHLDFFASTEHADDDRPLSVERNGITAREWSAVRRRVRDFDHLGRFATLLGYECNLLDGHRCVYFRSDYGVPWPPAQLGHKAARLWPLLDPASALAIPHHLGRSTKVVIGRIAGPGLDDVLYADARSHGGEVPDWRRPQPGDRQPALEIYSGHGTSEGLEPADPLAYENVGYLPSRSLHGPHYAWNAWANGHRVGVVAASDNHTAQPGLPHAGLTAVVSDELSREAVFDAIASRRTYGTTGERILLDLGLNGHRMGDVVNAGAPLAGTVFVAAPREIRFAEVFEIRAGDANPHRIARWDSPGRLLEAEFSLPAPTGRSAVYLRCELEGETEGRVARGWSSPIFVEPADEASGVELPAPARLPRSGFNAEGITTSP